MDTQADMGAFKSKQSGAHLTMPETPLTHNLRDIMRTELSSPDMHVSCIAGELATAFSSPASGPPVFAITFFISGRGRVSVDGGRPMKVENNTAVVFYSDRHVSGHDYFEAGVFLDAVHIRLSLNYIQSAAGQKLTSGTNGLVVDCGRADVGSVLWGLPMSADMIKIARDITSCSIEDSYLREVFMRGKVAEAFAVTFDAVRVRPSSNIRLTRAHKAGVMAAKQMLDDAIDKAWTIETLASEVALSETMLKRGFRQIFGKTVRQYLREARVNHARQLISDGHSVTDAALAAGFQNLSHFSKSFREITGVLPREYTRRPGHKTNC
ncbi:MAG: AraC family transcriptional regulator [Pseudomonadota bacterium]